MKKTLTLLLLALLSSAPLAGSSSVPNDLPRIDPADPHRFKLGDDQLYLAGYYPGLQALIVSPQVNASNPLASTYYKNLIDTMVSNRLNLLRVVLTMGMALENRPWLHPYQRSTQCCTNHSAEPGIGQHNKFDLDSFNPLFFNYWNAVFNYAASKGVILQVALLDGTHTARETFSPLGAPFEAYGWRYDYFEAGNHEESNLDVTSKESWYTDPAVKTRQKAFIRKAVDELGHHRNVIWEIINEGQVSRPPPNGSGDTWLSEMRTEYLNAQAANGHLSGLLQPFDLPDHRDLSGHNTPGNSTDPTDYQAEYECVHSGASTPGEFNCNVPGLVMDYTVNQQPLIDDNDCCTTPGSPEQLRKKAWLSLVSGAYPSMLVYHVTGGSSPIGLGIGNSNHETQRGMRYVGYTKKLIDQFGVDLVGMEPRDDLLTQGTGGPAWALAREHQEYIVYFFNSGSTMIPGLAGLTYQSHWFDPVNGASMAGPTSGTSFSTPGASGRDWALYIRVPPPAAPTGVQASDGTFTDRVRITWNTVPNATSYRLYRRAINTPPAGSFATTTATSFDDLTTGGPVTYYYWVQAMNTYEAGPLSASDTGYTSSTQTLTLLPNADAWVSENKPTYNYGTQPELRVRAEGNGYCRYSFLRFYVPPLNGTLTSAKLRLQVQETTLPAAAFYHVSHMSWNENTVTWNNWYQPGVVYQYLGSLSPLPGNTWVEFDITNQVNGSGQKTFGIASSHNQPNLDFWSRESSKPPKLTITYAP